MDIQWDDARLFLAVADAGSVSAAARQLKITQPTASRRIAQLEAGLGEPLFARSAGGATLTRFGETLLEPARRMAEGAGELGRAAARGETAIEGIVRLTAPPGIAFALCAPFAAELKVAIPALELEVVSSTRYLDLSRREADLALRFERPALRDQSLLASVQMEVAAYGTRELARKLRRRPGIADVPWIGWARPFDDQPPTSMLARKIPGFRPSFASDDFLVQYRAAELGVGAILLGRMRSRFERATPLVELRLHDLPRVQTHLHLVCAKSALWVPRIRAVADRLGAELARIETTRRRP